MRKQWAKIVAIVFSFLTLTCAFACSRSESSESETQNLATNPEILLNGFENAKDLNAVNLYNTFGSIERSTDAQYVTEGEYSAKCTVTHEPWKDLGTPYLYQATNIEYKNADYTDFSNVNMLTMDVYNTSKTTEKVGVQIVYDLIRNNTLWKYQAIGDSTVWFDLQSGYNLVNLNVIKDNIPVVTKNDGTKINQIIAVQLFFERPTEADRVFYIDNICLHKTDNPMSGEARSMQAGEICSFNQSWQYKLVQASDGNAGSDYAPKIMWQNAIVSDKDKNGAAIKVSWEHVIAPWPTTASRFYPGIIFDNELLSYADLTEYTKDYVGNDKFCFDIYVPEENGAIRITLTMYTPSGWYYQREMCCGLNGALDLKRGWNYIEIPVSELHSGEVVNTQRNFAKTSKITFGIWSSDTPNGVFYLDNLRVEKGGTVEEKGRE